MGCSAAFLFLSFGLSTVRRAGASPRRQLA
jgi:hypothetical protein